MPRRAAAGTAVIAVLVVVVIAVATVAFLYLSQRPNASLSQASSTSTSTTTPSSTSLTGVGQSSTSSESQSGTVTTSTTTPAECSGTQAPGPQNYEQPFGTLVTGTIAPAIICFQLFYFNSTGSLTINLTNGLSIRAGRSTPFNGASNFTVAASQDQLVIGGPTDNNEGAIVAYTVTAKQGASGTYQLDFLPPGGLNRFLLGNQEPLGCPYYGLLVAGDGKPNYVLPSSCLTISTTYFSSSTATAGATSYHTLAGVPYALIDGDIYFRALGMTNSTG